MKTTVKQLAAGTILSLILLWGNVSAEGTETKASGREAMETELQIEKWMTDESVWNVNSSEAEYALETETELQVENWMTSEKTWSINSGISEEKETSLELENWMTNDETWNKTGNEAAETALTVESWMTNNNIWNR